MPDKYGFPSYNEICNDIRGDSNLESELSGIGDEQIKLWILKAEERICQLAKVQDEWVLSMVTGASQFDFVENTKIVGATAASPIEITTEANHGRSNLDRLRILGVAGVPEANGEFEVTVTAANKFTLAIAHTLQGATSTTPISIKDPQHGFLTGDTVTVSGVLGNTAANGTWVITVVDQDNYTLNTSISNGTYSGGGKTVKATVGTGTFLSPSGRWYLTSQIPSFMKDLKYGKLTVDNFTQELVIADVPNQIDTDIFNNYFTSGYFPPYAYPVKGVVTRRDTHRFLRVYPPSSVDTQVTIYGSMQVNPHIYAADHLDAPIHLGVEWHEAIYSFVRSRVAAYLKDRKEETSKMNMFMDLVGQERTHRPLHPKMRITYR